MELKEMTIDQLEERKTALVAELDAPEADLDAIEEEMRAIKAELEARAAEEARKAEIRDKVAAGAGEVTKTFEKEGKKEMTNEEIRASVEYVDAFARYLKTGKDEECRSLLTTDASGVVPVPVLVDEIVKTAWENEEILSRVNKTSFRGNLKVAFERSADGAYVHNEGTSAPTEESLLIGIVTMIPKNIKKWITISDEAVAMGGEAFVRYIYEELTYQILKKLSEDCVTDIKGVQTSSDATHPGQAKITKAPSLTVIGEALANLSDKATNPVVIMNRLTSAKFLDAQAAANFAMDPYFGCPVLYSSACTAYDSADANAVYAIVGDLKGEQVNYPEGEGVVIKWDDLSLAESDLVKVVGRQYAAHAVTAPGRFCVIAKPSAATS